MIDMRFGQRMTVKSLVAAKNGRRIIRPGQRVQIYKRPGCYEMGRDNGGNFSTVLENAVEGEHFSLIAGEEPWPL